MGAGDKKPLFTPAVLVVTAGTSPDGILPKWQFWQVVEVGRCELAVAGDVGGITILVTPKKLLASPGPWQVSQPDVIPAWLNWAPEKVFIPGAGTKPLGMLLTWQLSQAAVVGTCAGDRPVAFMGDTPAKVVAVTLEPWQASQPDAMPVWLNSEPLNLAPSGTGVAAMLELLPTWQLTQSRLPMGMWLPGAPTMEKPLAGLAKLLAAAPWHWAQLLLVEGALAWMSPRGGTTEKSVPEWHAVQVALAEVGMWLAGLAEVVKLTVLEWQLEQSPATGCAPSVML